MTIRKLVFTMALCAALLAGDALVATPGSGVTAISKVVSANADVFAQVIGNRLKLRFGSNKAPINILNVHQLFAPGAFSGWHTHAGPGIVIVEQGTITVEQTQGCVVDYPQGSVLFEGGPGHIHNALNRTNAPVILDAYFFLPAFMPPGGNSRVDEPPQIGPCGAAPEDTDDDEQ